MFLTIILQNKSKACLKRNMKENSYDMQEELFVSSLWPQNYAPLDQGRVDEERRYYEMTPAISSKFSAAWDLTTLYIDAGFYDEAIAVCKEALGNPLLKNYEGRLFFKMGQISEHKKDFDAALQSYLKSIGADTDNIFLRYWQHNNIAFCYLIRKEFDKAEMHCRLALDFDEQDWKMNWRNYGEDRHWNAWKNMGVVMEHTGRYNEAASFYTTAIKISRGNERAVLHLRRLLKRHPYLLDWWKEPIVDLLIYYDVTI